MARRNRRYRTGGSYNAYGPKTLVGVRAFESFDALLTHSEGPSELSDYDRASRERGSSFSGTKDFAEAVHQARYGWAEGLKKITEMSEQIKNTVAQKANLKNDTFYAPSGAMVDVGRYLSGDPDCMMEYEQHEQSGRKIFSITLNVAASARVEAETLYNRGAAVIALVDLLEKGGFSCEINVVDVRESNGKLLAVKAPVKTAGFALEMERLAFAVASASFLRRIMFSINEREDASTRAHFGFMSGYGYAMPSNLPESATADEAGIYLPALFGNCEFDTQEGAVQWVIDQAGKLLELETADQD